MITRNELEDLKFSAEGMYKKYKSDYWKGYLKAIDYILST